MICDTSAPAPSGHPSQPSCAEASARHQRLRIAWETVNGNAPTAVPEDETSASMATRLRVLAHGLDTRQADLIALLVRFDDAQGWKASGARNCVAWMNAELNICPPLGREKLRVARALQELPQLSRLFACGRLSWSKVRALTRVATTANEHGLAASALDMTAGAVIRLCLDHRWKRAPDDVAKENELDALRHRRRELSWSTCADGNTRFTLVLTPERAAAFRACLTRAEEALFDKHKADAALDRPTAAQRRADAVTAMAETSLNADPADVRSADRYQVVVTIDADVLAEETGGSQRGCDCSSPPDVDLPLPVRASIQGSGAITAATAQRLACDASLVTMIVDNGEPLSIGRKSRVWPEPMVRALHARDRCCQFPGCESTRWLQAHHIVHWAKGGETSVDNGVLLCSHCHARVHEEGWQIDRAPSDAMPTSDEAFERQRLIASSDGTNREVIRRLDRYRPRFRFKRTARRYPALDRAMAARRDP